MNFSGVEDLIRSEQKKQSGKFIVGVELDEYISKLKTNAEIACHYVGGKCVGFVAFYCNDPKHSSSFITLVLIDSTYRRKGIASSLMNYVVQLVGLRGFRSIGLEVEKSNDEALSLYEGAGFSVLCTVDNRYFMRIDLMKKFKK